MGCIAVWEWLILQYILDAACICVANWQYKKFLEDTELELIQTQMAQKPMLRAEVGMRVRCANKASAE